MNMYIKEKDSEDMRCFANDEEEHIPSHESYLYKTRDGMGCIECDAVLVEGLKD